MKNFIFNMVLFCIAVGSGIGLFLMKYQVVAYEKELASIHRTIINDRREIHALKADWAVLTEPSRLRKLLAESELKQIKVQQIVSPLEVALKPVPVPPKKPLFQEEEAE